jgi:hypothetical protein
MSELLTVNQRPDSARRYPSVRGIGINPLPGHKSWCFYLLMGDTNRGVVPISFLVVENFSYKSGEDVREKLNFCLADHCRLSRGVDPHSTYGAVVSGVEVSCSI